MATNKIERGPASERVAQNVKQLREERRLSLDELASRMGELGRPILKSGLWKIEKGERRVDVDDLVALAIALEVNPNRLLLVDHAEVDDELELTAELAVTSKSAWAWASGDLTDDAGPWPWAKFAKHGGKPMEALAFQQATRPHDPPIYLTPEEWAVVDPIRQRFSRLEERLAAIDGRLSRIEQHLQERGGGEGAGGASAMNPPASGPDDAPSRAEGMTRARHGKTLGEGRGGRNQPHAG